jgi:hypothetical protein
MWSRQGRKGYQRTISLSPKGYTRWLWTESAADTRNTAMPIALKVEEEWNDES